MNITAINPRQDQIDALLTEFFPVPRASKSGEPTRSSARISDEQLIERMCSAAHGAEIQALITGDDTGHPSQSEADAALIHHLIWWSNHDLDQVERIMRSRARYRQKWDTTRAGRSWLRWEIEKADGNVDGGYTGATATPITSSASRHAAPRVVERAWPAPPDEDAFFGLAGDLVERIDPHTEADRTSLLVNTMLMFGAAVGSGPHLLVTNTRHTAKLFAGIVGPTATGRKGEGTGTVRRIFEDAEPERPLVIVGGLSSGEGLIWAVRDPVEKQEPVKKDGRVIDYQMVTADPGVDDKRLLVIEPEIARVLSSMARQGNTLSPVLRDAWDTNTLRVMTKTSPATATGSHIAIIAHVTPDELRAGLSDLSISNGLANRFMWMCSRRSKLLPDPEPLEGTRHRSCVDDVRRALKTARQIGRVTRDEGATEIWQDTYGELSSERGTGLKASLCARAPQMVLRMALVHALMNGSTRITADHLVAAMALWDYSERSIVYLFGDATGNPTADAIYRALATHALTRTEISDVLGRHKKASDIDDALQLLLSLGKVHRTERDDTGGRHAEVWTRT